MLRPFSSIVIKQMKPYSYKANGVLSTMQRTESIDVDFATLYEINQGWETHTDTGRLVLAKNVYLDAKDASKPLFIKSGTNNVILGSGSSDNTNLDGSSNTISPLIMRGDIITILDGYYCFNEVGKEVLFEKSHFFGYVSKIHSTIPIEIEFEDNFYLLKHVPVGETTAQGNLIDLCKRMLVRVNAEFHAKNSFYPELKMYENTDSLTANFSLGFLDIGDITCAQLLDRIKSQYKIESFFVDNILHFGFPIYDEERANSDNYFEFQNNIHDDQSLEYKSKQDIVLSAIVHCQNITETTKKLKNGVTATKKERESILIYWDIPTETFKYIVKQKGEPFPPNTGGERYDFIYPISPKDPKPSVETLFQYGIKQLEKYYYTGFRGSFTTFGFPFVEWNDNINIIDPVIADRNGMYKVRRVVRTGGIDGIKQEIFIDYKLNVEIQKPTDYIYMI